MRSVMRVGLVTCAMMVAASCTAGDRPGAGTDRPGRVRQAHRSAQTATDTFNPPPAESRAITLVGEQNFGGRGAFGDLWVHGDHAYVGSYRSGGCRGYGVSVANVSNPRRPTPVSTFAAYPHTSAEDIEVLSVRNRFFNGSLAVVGLQDCSETTDVAGQRGLDLWDTTNPRSPRRLSFIPTSAAHDGGVHELDVFQRDGRVYVIIANNFFGVEDPLRLGETRIFDITDPRHPAFVSDWSIGRDGRLAFGSELFSDTPPGNCAASPGRPSECRAATSGGYPVVSAHGASVSADGTRAFLSYWDAGAIVLDIRDPRRPRMIGRANSPPTDEGDMHSAVSVPYFCNQLMITTDEDWSPVFNLEGETDDVWGYARLWDIANPSRPRQIGRIESPHSASARADGYYSVHNPVTIQNLAFFSWYTDGLRVYDLANPRAPELLGYFDAPRVPDPEPGEFPNPTGAVWGLSVKPPYVYLSDMNAGLYIVRLAPSIMARFRGPYNAD
jgi:hypothetical protein